MGLEKIEPDLRSRKWFKYIPREKEPNRAARRKAFFASQMARVEVGKAPRHVTGAVRRGMERGKAA